MKYAVIKACGKQYRVAEGDVVDFENLNLLENAPVSFSDVLLYVADTSVHVGTPIIADAMVTGTVVGAVKGKKVRVARFKAKAKYRKVTGFRQHYTRVKIDVVSLSGVKEVKKATVAKKSTKKVEAAPKTVKKTVKKTSVKKV